MLKTFPGFLYPYSPDLPAAVQSVLDIQVIFLHIGGSLLWGRISSVISQVWLSSGCPGSALGSAPNTVPLGVS